MPEKYTRELLEEAAKTSVSVSEVCRKLGINYISGGMSSHIRNRLNKFNIDTDHFLGQGHNKGKISKQRRKPEEILVYRTNGLKEKTHKLVRALKEIGRQYICEDCGNKGFWNYQSLTLEVHHKDNDPMNNSQENLSFLCPNCHSLK